MERCPSCRARYKGESVCARCGTELTFPLLTEQQAREWSGRAVQYLANGDKQEAAIALQQALRLHREPLAVALDAFLKQEDLTEPGKTEPDSDFPFASPNHETRAAIMQRKPSIAGTGPKPDNKLKGLIERMLIPAHRNRQPGPLQRCYSFGQSLLNAIHSALSHRKEPRRYDKPESHELNDIIEAIVSAATEVHCLMGPGLLTCTYEACLCRELDLRRITYQLHCPLSAEYKDQPLPSRDQVNLLIENRVAVLIDGAERRFIRSTDPLPAYLRIGTWDAGVLIDFNVTTLKKGVFRCYSRFGGSVTDLTWPG